MEPLTAIFDYLPEYRIGICKIHRHGVLRSQLPLHLQKSHGEVAVATRNAIVLAAAAEYPEWATSADSVIVPAADSQPVAYLPVFKDGLRCSAEI